MTSSKSTKRALLTSALAILACAAMLIGTTFAWFTDTASTAVNKIVSGKLDVALEMWNGEKWENAEGKTLNFLQMQDGKLVQNADILWEPGATYQLPQLRVVNDGNLALKYTVKVTGVKGSAKLLEAIDFTVATKTETDNAEVAPLSDWEGVLLPKGAEKRLDNEDVYESESFTIAGTMKTTAGNDYQDLTVEGIAITVYATQYTYESDSKDNTYDENAAYKGSQDFTSGTHILNKGGVALNPNEIAVNVSGEDTDVTITGGFYNGGEGGNNVCVWARNGGSVTIKDGTFTVGGDAKGEGNSVIYSYDGNITIEGGFFYTNYSWGGKYYVLNMNNDHPGTITVKGGTFVNFNPAGGDDKVQPTNFVAEGYSVIAETKANGDVWYTVVEGKAASNNEELADVISSATEPVTVTLGTGTYELPDLENKELTIKGTKDTVIDLTNKVKKADSVTFDGVTVNFGKDNYKGFQHTKKVVYKDCVINGFMTTYGDMTFENCTFNSGNNQYAINFYGGENFTLTNCHFYGVDKNVYIYQETLDSDKNVTFNKCDFHMTATSNAKSAVMLNAPLNYNTYKYNVVITDCTAEGTNATAAEDSVGKTNYQGLYGLKHIDGNGNGKLVEGTVTVNGTVVYQN